MTRANGSLAGGHLLDGPTVSVGIAEEDERAPGELLDLAHLHASLRERRPRGADAGHEPFVPGRWSGRRILQRARRRERLAGLEQRLEAGEDHRPAAVELVVRALAQLVVSD